MDLFKIAFSSISVVENFIKDVSMFLSAGEISVLPRDPPPPPPPPSPLHYRPGQNLPPTFEKLSLSEGKRQGQAGEPWL